eukprot:SAG31_NODE_259_length_18917_cov_28.559677_6_plen_165_part_00
MRTSNHALTIYSRPSIQCTTHMIADKLLQALLLHHSQRLKPPWLSHRDHLWVNLIGLQPMQMQMRSSEESPAKTRQLSIDCWPTPLRHCRRRSTCSAPEHKRPRRWRMGQLRCRTRLQCGKLDPVRTRAQPESSLLSAGWTRGAALRCPRGRCLINLIKVPLTK